MAVNILVNTSRRGEKQIDQAQTQALDSENDEEFVGRNSHFWTSDRENMVLLSQQK